MNVPIPQPGQERIMMWAGEITVAQDAIRIAFDQAALEEVCRRWRVREMALFGSVLRDDFTPESDIDVLVDLAEDSPAEGGSFTTSCTTWRTTCSTARWT